MNGYRCYQPFSRCVIISCDIQIIEIDGVILDDEPELTLLDIIHGPTLL